MSEEDKKTKIEEEDRCREKLLQVLSSLGKKDYNKKTEVKEEDKEGKEVEYKKIN